MANIDKYGALKRAAEDRENRQDGDTEKGCKKTCYTAEGYTDDKCLKLISLKLSVRATVIVIAIKLQYHFARTHDKTKVNVLTAASEMVFKFIEMHYIWLKQLISTKFNSLSLLYFACCVNNDTY